MSYFPSFNVASFSLTAAQIKSLATAPIQIIAGVSGKLILIKTAFMVYHFNTTPFGVVGSQDTISFVWGNTSSLSSCLINQAGANAKGFVDQSQNMIFYLPPQFFPSLGINYGTNLLGANMYIYQYGGTGSWPSGTNWTSGDGTITGKIKYQLLEG